MPTEPIELADGLLVEVQSDPRNGPRQIVAGAADRVDGAMDWTRVAFCIQGADADHRGQGTGFACIRKGG